MKRWLGKLIAPLTFVLIAGLLAAGIYAALWLLRASLESYQPLPLEVGPAQSLTNVEGDGKRPGTTAPLTNRVVLVVVNGLGIQDAEKLPALSNDKFKNISAGAYLFTNPVYSTLPGLVPILTGAGVDFTGGLSLDPSQPLPAMENLPRPSASHQLQTYDNLFATVRRSQFTTALFGTSEWYEAIPTAALDFYTTFDPRQPATDVTDNALNFLKKKSANFTVIQFSSLAQAIRDYGYNSPQALEARQNLNTALQRLTSDEIELPQTTLLITGDLDETYKAGDRWVAPLVMVGQAVQPGDKIWGRQEDLASTIAALLGVEIPRHNQGRILSPMLSMPAIDQGEKSLALVEQRLALATSYRVLLGLTLPLAVNDPSAVEAEKNLKVAQQNYRLGSYEGIEGAVDPIIRYTRSDMESARQEWFSLSRWQRAILAVVLLALPLLLLLIWRSAMALVAIFGALLASSLPYAIYLAQGRSFNFNSISLNALQETSLLRSGIALFAGLLIPLLFFDWAENRRKRRSGRIDLKFEQMAGLRKQPFPFNRLFVCCALMLGWLVYFSGLIWLIWYYWRFGYFAPFMGQPALLPDHSASFLQFFALNHLLGFALWMIPAPLLLAVLYWFKRKSQGRKSEEAPARKSKKRQATTETSIVKA